MTKPFGIFASTKEKGVWTRVKWFATTQQCEQAFKDLTKTPREGRRRYLPLPVQSDKRQIYFPPELIDKVYDAAK